MTIPQAGDSASQTAAPPENTQDQGTVASPSEQDGTATTPAPDTQATQTDWEAKFMAEHDRANVSDQASRTLEGRYRALQKSLGSQMSDLGKTQKRIVKQMGNPDADPEQFAAETEQERVNKGLVDAQATFETVNTANKATINKRILKLGYSSESILAANPAFERIRDEYEVSENAMDKSGIEAAGEQFDAILKPMEEAVESAKHIAAMEAARNEGAAIARQQATEQSLDMNTGPNSSSPGEESLDDLVAKDTRYMTYGEKISHGKKIDAALRS